MNEARPSAADPTPEAPASDEPNGPAADSATEAPSAPEAPATPGAPAEPTFADLDLPRVLQGAVDRLGFTTPSPIQSEAIPQLLAGRDVIGVAQTGTGKTAAFGLPMLTAVDPSERAAQALVLAPTRELAMQVAEAISTFAQDVDGLSVTSVYGGSPYGPQERALSRGTQVVVGTPGRVIDHLKRGNLHLETLRYLVLDEADEMLRMGFAEDVDEILSHAPQSKQVALFSATMPPAIQRVAEEHMSDPVRVSVSRQASTTTNVSQRYAVVPFRHKTGALARVLATSDAEAAIVFVRTRSAAEEVGTALVARGVVAATISGDVPQKEREKIVERLREGSLQVLVATDVAARGLDVDKIGLVVNFDVPGEPEAYVHRIGRTGRAGRTGEALTFVAPHERRKLRAIEKTTRQTLQEISIPSPRDVSAHRTEKLLASVPERAERGRLDLYLEKVDAFLASSGMEPRMLAAVLAATAVGDDGPGAEVEGDEEFTGAHLKGSDRDRESDGKGRPAPGQPEKGFTSYRVSVGHSHGAKPAAIVGAITGEGGLNGKSIGKIDIFGSFSLVQIRGSLKDDQIDRIGHAKIAGRTLRISEDRGPRAGGRREHGSRRPDSREGGRHEGGRRFGGPRREGGPRRDSGRAHGGR
ncbi:DEAD/DEAH box helicase [Brachybacterium sp. MASK1Z-5]|uniref:RNA helicase n=1 Tax=Brachybacterium halotolerans TaxID=2795215 RepID=A0ABS1B5B3_9MICO|nr:DEAD/DEAH box helicase [Brachybacterium halotolerans]MBK0329833.1 DEAD/DEAH box helicase [Brachybacterium halotolerans]